MQNELFTLQFDNRVLLLNNSNIYHGKFVLKETDTFVYNIGFNISNLSEKCPNVIYSRDSVDLLNTEKDVIYVNDKHYDIDKLRERNVSFFTMSDLRIKLVYPVDTSGRGLIGIYIDSMVHTKVGNVKLNIFSRGLKSSTYNEVIRTFYRINISPWDTSKISIPYGSYYLE